MLARTGLSVAEHQKRTIDSFATLKAIAPPLSWLPVVQGWHLEDYLSHVEQYRAAGFDLRLEPRVGVGSVCRRQATREGASIIRGIAALGICVHAFGIKLDGLRAYHDVVASADSMTWSFIARRRRVRLEGCTHSTCSNCFRWAHEWYRTRIDGIDNQTSLPF